MSALLSIDRVRAHGVVGAGGAGFPTYAKLSREAEVVILNAAECEPLLHKDKVLLEHHGPAVLDGLGAIAEHVGARRVVVALKEKAGHEALVAQVKRLASDRDFEVHLLTDTYPAGDEFITVYEVTGRVIPPGGLPLDVGCLVQNVETALNVARDEPVIAKYLSVAGAVAEPVTVRAPLGLSFAELLRAVGVDPSSVGTVLVGGVMMGRVAESLEEVVTRTTGALVCLPQGHPLARRYLRTETAKARIGRSACDQCSFCTELCPRYLLGHPVEPHLAMRGLEFNRMGEGALLGAQFCCECNLCTLYSCPEDLHPMEATRAEKHAARERGERHPWTGRTDVRPHSMQAFRRVPVSSLKKKLGLTQFRDVGPLVEIDWRPEQLRVPLRQHVGTPAEPVVREAARVARGAVLAEPPPDALGVPIHAPLDGVVERLLPDAVLLRCENA